MNTTRPPKEINIVAEKKLAKPTKKQIGLAGETVFELECNIAKATYNKSEQDERAWDYLIELDAEKIKNVPLDRQPEHPKFQVQIKSSTGRNLVQIKLSNAEIMANSQLPFFIIFYAVNENLEVVGKCGVHFWQDEIEKTLERLRQNTNEQGESSKPSNQIKLSFTFNDENKINGNVVDWMKGEAGDFEAYSSRKQQIVESVGDPFHSITFNASPQDMVDLMIGDKPELDIGALKWFDNRFDTTFLIEEIENTRISVESQADHNATMVFKTNGEELKFATDIITPNIPNLPDSLAKFRFRNPVLEMSLKLGEGESVTAENITFADFSKKHDLQTLQKLLKVMRGIVQGEKGVELRHEGETMFHGEFNLNNHGMDLTSITTMQCICETVSRTKEEQDEISLSVNDLYSVSDFDTQASNLAVKGLQLRFDEPIDEKNELNFILVTIGVFAAGKYFAAIVKRNIKEIHANDDNQTFVTFAEPKWLKTMRYNVDESATTKAKIEQFYIEGLTEFNEGFETQKLGAIFLHFTNRGKLLEDRPTKSLEASAPES